MVRDKDGNLLTRDDLPKVIRGGRDESVPVSMEPVNSQHTDDGQKAPNNGMRTADKDPRSYTARTLEEALGTKRVGQ